MSFSVQQISFGLFQQMLAHHHLQLKEPRDARGQL
jgi:hypothetical protein